MIKDYWIYQKRDVPVPWALYVIKEYNPGDKFKDVVLDVTIYSEQIENNDHMLSFLNWHYPTISSYVSRFANEIAKFGGEFNPDDAAFVEQELHRVFFS